ncbi:MAG TPA: sugar phosphate isomerase/epimerase family protein [Candidatus Hydrogenedentes bacterium]|nr:sugar phosphate isomerase/epimerase family protein [Candidatus Hydrogenedentota bacterium]
MSAQGINRRSFLITAAASVAAGATLSARAADPAYKPLLKGVQLGHLSGDRPDLEKFKYAKEIGFDGVEIPPLEDLDAAKRMAEAANGAGIRLHSVIYGGWGAPMSHSDPATVAKGKKEIEQALRTAQAVGADAVLLVPAVVNDTVGYGEAWERSQKNIRDLIPLAAELKVVIAVENVWNKFLLSPLEFARYVDEFNSPWIRAYIDVGNMVIFGYPEDWIRTIGKRIVKLHIKDFKRNGFQWCKLPYEGDVNWPAVRKALDEIGYEGFGTEEFPGGDDAYLRELSRRMTLLGEGAAEA